MKKYLLLYCGITILFLEVLVSCISKNSNNKKIQELSTNSDLYIVDIDNAVKEDKIFLSEYFKMPKVILLEATPKSLIGKISVMQTTADYIFILDKKISKSLFVFDKEGKFIRQIGQMGHGPGEYRGISDFTLDVDNKEVYLIDPMSLVIHKYNYETGKFISSLSVYNTEMMPFSIQYYNGKLYADARFHQKAHENKYMLQEINKQSGKPINKWLNYEEYNKGSNVYFNSLGSFFYCRTNSIPKYANTYMDTLKYIDNNQIKPYMVIKDKDWITTEDVKKYSKISQERSQSDDIFYLIHNEKIAYCISDYVEIGNLVYFYYRKEGTSNSVIYDKSTNYTRMSSYLWNDLTNTKFILNTVLCSDEKGIYEFLTLDDLISLKTRDVNPETDKYEELMNLDIDNNPVIFYYERK